MYRLAMAQLQKVLAVNMAEFRQLLHFGQAVVLGRCQDLVVDRAEPGQRKADAVHVSCRCCLADGRRLATGFQATGTGVRQCSAAFFGQMAD